MQEMNSGIEEETIKRLSSVVSSEASSQISVSSGSNYEIQSRVSKKKSSSMSCLPDRISDFDYNSSTLPPNLDKVKLFEENLLPKGAVSARSWDETAEFLEEQLSEDEFSSNDDQRSSVHSTNNSHETTDGKGLPVKLEIDLSEINTDTRTFVRSSALDILSKFPQTETISSMDMGNKHKRLNVVEEDAKERGDGCLDSGPIFSKYVHQSAQIEVTSWSSTGDIKKKNNKKGLFKDNSKVKDKSSPESNDTELTVEKNAKKAKKAKKTTKKEKAKSVQSLKWMKIFRVRHTVTETQHEDGKNKKKKLPLQKSQSLDGNSLPRSSQLNRMNSFRKLFKRTRDSAALVETKPIDNQKCMEISYPILKSDFKSKNLVDREVFLRERSYQIDKSKTKHEKKENETALASSNIKSSTNPDNETERKSDEVTVNGFVKSQETPEPQESPVAPVRLKHLQKKQRLSMQSAEELQHDYLTADDEDTEKRIDDNDKSSSMAHSKGCDELKVEINKDDKTSCFPIEIKGKECLDCNETENADSNISESTKQHIADAIQSQVNKPTVHDEMQEVKNDNDENLNYVIVESEPKYSSVTADTSFTSLGGSTSTPPNAKTSVVQDVSHGKVRDTFSTPQSPESEYEEVFVDRVNDEKFSVDSATVLVDKPQVKTRKSVTQDTSMPSGRSISDVNSRESQRAIGKVIQKKPASFSGVRTSWGGDMKGSNTPSSPVTTVRSPTVRRPSTFRVPSFKFEASEPISLITDMVPVTFPNFLTDRRSQIVLELFTTERTYVRSLETMIELFKKPMLAGKMDEKDVDAVFSNLNDIFAVNKDLLFLLWEKVKHWSSEQCIAQIFIDMEEKFKMYATYCKNFDKADFVLKQKIKKNKDFERFLKVCYQDPLCQPGLDLPAYLITIVQRIPRYLLLLKDLYKKTPSSHPDYNTLQTAQTRMNKVAEYINSQLQEVHGKKAMQELRSTVIGLKAYAVKGRTLLKEAEVCLMSPKKPYKCLLFNDIMVFAVQGPKDRSEIEMTLELKTLWFEDLKKLDPQTTKCDAIELYTPHRPYTMYACSRTEKRVWIQKLRTAIVTLLYGPDCEDPDGMDTSRRKASDTYVDGSVYCGEYLNGKRDGHGVMAWPNRTRYEGSWADDERHGIGQLTYYTGEKYVGNWVADKKDGDGRQTYVNNDVYNGQWKQGKMHGKGVIAYANGDRYDGEMWNNEVEGKGEMTCSSGMIYKGEWRKSKRHGEGHLFLPNGNEYKGEFLNDRICGSGQMIYVNGDEYNGEWVNELRHGSGVFKLVNGSIYDGQWTNDFMNGQGKMTYPNGDEYTGTWYQNKRVGKGQLIHAHGDTYNGQWQADTMHGKGVMYYKDGSVYEGEWENGKQSGHGKTVYKDKTIYEGEYYLGFRHGRGQLIFPNNVLYVGEWKWDKFDGNGVFNDPNTDYSYSGDWYCGMREGSGIEISYRTRYEGTWKANMKHGTGVEKSHAGHVFKGQWKENRKHGEGIRRLRSNIEEIQHWHEGHLTGGEDTVAEGLPPLPRR